MNRQIVLTKKAGHLIPEALLKLYLGQNPTTFGFAVQDSETHELSITRTTEIPALEGLIEFNKAAEKYQAMVCFGMLGKGFGDEDILPFIINDADEKPFFAIGIEGDFPRAPQSGRIGTDEYNLASNLIIPTIIEHCENCGDDYDKLTEKLRSSVFENNFKAQIGQRGILSIMPVDGDIIFHGKNELGDTYDWGSTSDKLTFGDKEEAPLVAEAPKKKGFSFGGKKPAEVSKPIITTDDKGVHTIVKDAATPGTGPRPSVPAVTPPKEEKAPIVHSIRPPGWLHKNEDVKNWYVMVFGRVPDLWRKKIAVLPIIPTEEFPKNLEDLQERRAAKLKTDLNKKAPVTGTAAPAPKSGNEIAAQRQATAVTEKVDNNLPILGAAETEATLDFVAKHLDVKSNEIMNPAEIAALEKKFPSFSASLGLKPQELLDWPMSGVFDLAKAQPKAIALAFFEMRNLWRSTLKLEDLVGTDKKVVTTDKAVTTTTTNGGTVKTESVSTEAPPVKKKGFSFGKKAA